MNSTTIKDILSKVKFVICFTCQILLFSLNLLFELNCTEGDVDSGDKLDGDEDDGDVLTLLLLFEYTASVDAN